LVGGSVRDQLLGLTPKDLDYVVVGSDAEAMRAAGFVQVGRDFPVFLHPVTKHEYALARTERKTGKGYHGFTVIASPEVSLEADLQRRDLTINAMARAADGTLIDPYGGQRDLETRQLRHVSEAFAEDPLRVLRVARFAARYAHLGFRIAPETLQLMRVLTQANELEQLTAERVYSELARALLEPTPSVFLRSLRACGALARLLPEIDALYGVPQRAEFHPEICAGIHQEMVSDAASKLAPQELPVAFAALLHDLGKALTPSTQWPRHLEHELAGVPSVEVLCTRLRVPSELADLARLVCRWHLQLHRWHELRPGTRLELLEALDAFRKPERVRQFALACHADKRGRLGFADANYSQAEGLLTAFQCARAVGTEALLAKGLKGPALGAALRQARIAAIARH
jgi:tRNA nucleotidyltransferase (CCA-adding enzyme)